MGVEREHVREHPTTVLGAPSRQDLLGVPRPLLASTMSWWTGLVQSGNSWLPIMQLCEALNQAWAKAGGVQGML